MLAVCALLTTMASSVVDQGLGLGTLQFADKKFSLFYSPYSR